MIATVAPTSEKLCASVGLSVAVIGVGGSPSRYSSGTFSMSERLGCALKATTVVVVVTELFPDTGSTGTELETLEV